MNEMRISLTTGTRDSLLSLQETSRLMTRTQQRLASGKDVATPLDNATNFFAAAGHLQRAQDISARKDGINEGIQTVKAATHGIAAITSVLTTMQAVAHAAQMTANEQELTNYSNTFYGLRSQVTSLATDSGYRGTNLLNNETLTIDFSPRTGESTFAITGFDASADGLGIGNLVTAGSGGVTPNQSVTVAATRSYQANVPFTEAVVIGPITQSTIDDTLQASFSNNAPPGLSATVAVTGAEMLGDALHLTGTVDQAVPVSLPKTVTIPNPSPPPATTTTIVPEPTYLTISWGGTLERTFPTWSTPENILEVQIDGIRQENNYALDANGNIVFTAAAAPTTGQVVTFIREETWNTTNAVTPSLKQVSDALALIRSKASELASTQNIATTRLTFNSRMSDILSTGADNLTLADMNQEAASMLALQTRLNLSITALSLSARSQQAVLQLF
jgi:flagellin-like hook-associated protein FlgL